MKNVNDEVAEVFQNPTTFSASFSADGLDPSKKELIFNFGGNGLNISFITACRNEEHISKREWFADIKRNDVCGALTVSCSNCNFQYVESLF